MKSAKSCQAKCIQTRHGTDAGEGPTPDARARTARGTSPTLSARCIAEGHRGAAAIPTVLGIGDSTRPSLGGGLRPDVI